MLGHAHSCFNTTFVTVLSYRNPDHAVPTRVSIQLLLLFYMECMWQKHMYSSFNTTFVTVLFPTLRRHRLGKNSFNTTFVTVLLRSKDYTNQRCLLFQYNFCYCSIQRRRISEAGARRFQYNFCYCSIYQRSKDTVSCVQVSIQLLLLFYEKAKN